MTNLNKLFCSALKCQFEKHKYTHAQTYLFHSEKNKLSDCPQPNVSKGSLEIIGAVCVRVIGLNPALHNSPQFSQSSLFCLIQPVKQWNCLKDLLNVFTCYLNHSWISWQ